MRSVAYFRDGARLLTAGHARSARVWDISPDERPRRELELLATVLSARHIDVTGTLVPLEPAAIRDAWLELSALHPSGMPVPPARAAAWHLDQAAACELTSDGQAAGFHLEQAFRIAPGDARVEARRRSERDRAERK